VNTIHTPSEYNRVHQSTTYLFTQVFGVFLLFEYSGWSKGSALENIRFLKNTKIGKHM